MDKMQYNGVSCQPNLIMLLNQIIDFCFSDKEKPVDLFFNFFLVKYLIWYSNGNLLLKLCSSVKVILVGKELIQEMQQVMLKD